MQILNYLFPTKPTPAPSRQSPPKEVRHQPPMQPPLPPHDQLLTPISQSEPPSLEPAKRGGDVAIQDSGEIGSPTQVISSPQTSTTAITTEDVRLHIPSQRKLLTKHPPTTPYPFLRHHPLFNSQPPPPPLPPPPLSPISPPSTSTSISMPPPRPTTSTNPSGSKTPKSEYISTDTGNKVARRSQLHGTQHIILGGRAVIQPQVCIRGDLIRLAQPAPAPAPAPTTHPQPTVSVSIGRYSFISANAVLRPPSKLSRGILSYHALRVGEHVLIEAGAVVEAAAIGDRVVIGEGSVVGKFAILKEGCVVLPGAVVPGGMVVPSGVVVGGRPARLVGEVGDGWEGGDLREMWRAVG